MRIRISAVSDKGIERCNNEDAVLVCTDIVKGVYEENVVSVESNCHEAGTLIVVADGMGGANAGEVASSIAVNTILQIFKDEAVNSLETKDAASAFLQSVVKRADKAINDHVAENPDTIGMGTTIVIQWIIASKAYIAWCGDSRCYCFNPDTGLKRLTKDHSYVQELLDSHQITEEEVLSHPDNNLITRCLGDTDSEAEADVITYNVKSGDILLACTDGLCGFCSDADISAIMYENHRNINVCRNKLLEAAMKTGGYDNITISLCVIDENITEKTGFLQFMKSLMSRIFYMIYKDEELMK